MSKTPYKHSGFSYKKSLFISDKERYTPAHVFGACYDVISRSRLDEDTGVRSHFRYRSHVTEYMKEWIGGNPE